jgi:hypothetical protein
VGFNSRQHRLWENRMASCPCCLGSVAGVEKPVGLHPFLIDPSFVHLSWDGRLVLEQIPPFTRSLHSALDWVGQQICDVYFCAIRRGHRQSQTTLIRWLSDTHEA